MTIKLQNNIYIIISIICAFILRYSVSFTHSYSSDELSAINRLNIDGFQNIIEKAVKTGDMHPAGVQFFEEFWSSLFGTSEIVMRFPFVIFGTLSVYLTYYIGKTYISTKSGILASLILSVSYFPIIQSELARPYSPGLFFSLLVSLYFLKILFPTKSKQQNNWLNSILLGLCFTITMYIHYFAFMYVAFIGFTGLFYLNKKNYLQYLLSGFIAVLLFLPHYNITLYHLSIDGGLQWLGKPSFYWLFEFIYFVFNESILFSLVILTLIIYTIIKKKPLSTNKITKLFGIWFIGIYLIGYLFSIYSSPILKFPVMIFPLPMFVLVITSYASVLSNKALNIVYLTILCTGISTTIFEKKLYTNEHFGVFKELAISISSWKNNYGEDNVDIFMNVSNPNYLNYYAKQINDSLIFKVDNMEFDSDKKIREMLKNSKKNYCIIGYSARLTLPQVFETCKEFYPKIVDYIKLNNCAVFLLAKNTEKEVIQNRTLVNSFRNSINNNQKKGFVGTWRFNLTKLKTTPPFHYLSDSTTIYGPDLLFKKEELSTNYRSYLKIEISTLENSSANLTATLTVKRNGHPVLNKKGENLWMGHDFDAMLIDKNEGYFALSIPEFIKPSDDIQIGIWNRTGKPVKIKEIKIYALENIWN